MAKLKITKKHHKHINNPFPSAPKSLPFLQGILFFESHAVPSNKNFSIGKDFLLSWSNRNGGSLSITHISNPTKSLWSSVPGQAFVSAALAETEVEESRGSFVVNDKKVHMVCNHQTVEDIRQIDHFDELWETDDPGFPSGSLKFDHDQMKEIQYPMLLISGIIFSMKKRFRDSSRSKHAQVVKEPHASARYWILLDQTSKNDIRFQVKFGYLCSVPRNGASPDNIGRYRSLRVKLGRSRKKELGYLYFPRPRKLVAVSSAEEEVEDMNLLEFVEFTRVFFTYSSEVDERFYGFGEQFSHMNFKGKRVPIFVQEQGIGRGDQPITFAANLVSHRLVICIFVYKCICKCIMISKFLMERLFNLWQSGRGLEYNLCSFAVLLDIKNEIPLP